MRPIIGISTYVQDARWGPWELPAALLPYAYVRSVELAGGRPLLVPPLDEAVDETLGVLDGLVLSGGVDVDPQHYGAARHPETTRTQPERDRAELVLLEAALGRNLPVLAICRGMQLLNVAHGGSLHQHLPDLLGHNGHRETHGIFSEHEVRLRPGSRIAAYLGERTRVYSSHHQGVEELGQGIEAVGWAEDGPIEAIEDPGRRFALGVLWHPEADEDTRLFAALVAEARAHRADRSAGPSSVPGRD
jgi:gamma-glutamyl-gamma-aminobutyrate hydrolase PuuD